ncbi:thiol-disulfide oxidoreductase ResA [Sutcliffiella halmapala]|uniref:thiol-disulfide oxidoreductase ResA n=1 Tax=Sutcliffiella halmapala TaxID=79882 RepID=UPI000995936D|nr:thiol-disulfide oxidoreductase ResA [Sutcliffiella halmapala]
MKKKRKRLVFRVGILSIMFLMTTYALYNLLVDNNSINMLVGKPATNFVGNSMNDEVIELNQLKANKTVINFWASWCEPCKREMPAFEEIYQSNKNNGVSVISINVGDSNLVVNQFIKKYNLSFPVIIDNDSSIRQSYKVDRLPVSFLVNSNGVIEKLYEGELTEEMLEEWVN